MIQFKKENLTVFQSSLYMTTSALIQTDEAIIMTDPTWLPVEIETIKYYVEKIKGDRELYIIYTHSDFDHIIGAGAFLEAKVIATEEFENNLYKKETLQMIQQFDQKYYVQRNYEPIYPAVDIVVTEDGQTLELGDVSLLFNKAPGHTADGLFTLVEPYGIFLSGDYLSDVEFPFIFDSYKKYVKTMEKARHILTNYHINYHVPGHGLTTDDQHEIERRLEFSHFYLEQLVTDNEIEKELQKKYSFYEGMKANHVDNLKLAKQELKR